MSKQSRIVMCPQGRKRPFCRAMRREPVKLDTGQVIEGAVIKKLVFNPGDPVTLTAAEFRAVEGDIGTGLYELTPDDNGVLRTPDQLARMAEARRIARMAEAATAGTATMDRPKADEDRPKADEE